MKSASGQSFNEINCTNNPARSWWDVVNYRLAVNFMDTTKDVIKGQNIVTAKIIAKPDTVLQIDLDTSLILEKAVWQGFSLSWHEKKGHYFISIPQPFFRRLKMDDTFSIKLFYRGIPKEAHNPPWDDGFVRTHDSTGHLWWAVTCEAGGASVWFPCKNYRGDEPDSVLLSYTVPLALKAIGNGRLVSLKTNKDKASHTFTWKVVNPINNYDITFYLGDYVHWTDSFAGLKGRLDLNYYVLRGKIKKAKKQFREVKTMLACFEKHFGPYPFYKDGYKLVQAPYLGMEHQSAIAYGNHFKMGYLGLDRSHTGVGLLFDFIIVHESAHEWFGNSISVADPADSWVQEGFASYAETVYAQCIAGKRKAFIYQRGKRATIQNINPVEGRLGYCDDGSSDEYDKAGFLIHQIRLMMKNDTAFFGMIQAMDAKYFHQIVTGKEIENFIINYTHLPLAPLFNQYLRTAPLPILAFTTDKNGLIFYQWKKCVKDFNMPVIYTVNQHQHWLYPTTKPKPLKDSRLKSAKQISRDFLINIKWD